MVCLHVEDVKFGLQRGYAYFVHVDVWAVEFQTANTIRYVSVPSQAIGSQVKQFYITVIIASRQTPFFLVISVSKGNGPAVRLNRFVFRRLKTYNRRLLSWIPNANAAISSTRDEFWCSEVRTLSTNSVDLVAHVSVGLHIVFLDASLNIVNN